MPTHFDFFSQLATVTPAISTPVWAGVFQWTRDFLKANTRGIFNTERSEDPLGRHLTYVEFQRRNEILARLNSVYKDVGPIEATYHTISPQDRLQIWSAHMAHWIVPVSFDMPIRIFDALITGGIPIVPVALKHHPSLDGLRDHMMFYGPADIDNPEPVTGAANALFRNGGLDGIRTRFELAYQTCHVDSRLRDIIGRLKGHYRPQG